MKLFVVLAVCFVGATAQDILAQPCDAAACQLPSCRCSGVDIPGGFAASEIPQMVLLTYDDAVSALNFNQYYQPLLFDRQNPFGCPVSATFFIPHEYTDYSRVHELWRRGHDIALHSITHKAETPYWQRADYDTWVAEFAGERELVSNFAVIPPEQLVGTRVPFLQIGGNDYYKMLSDEGFVYDSSWPTLQYSTENALWPYTLDYRSIQDCQIGPCPNISLPGNPWVMPMVDWMGPNEFPCAMIDTCIVPEDADEIFTFMQNNFNRVYNGNRAPIGVYLHAAWLTIPTHLEAYERFLNFLGEFNDVFLVSVKQAQQWMETPTPMANLADFAPWGCPDPPATQCPTPTSCYYKTTPPGGERYMQSCVPCPPEYPWLGNPLGQPTH